jgi:hypothetical protein
VNAFKEGSMPPKPAKKGKQATKKKAAKKR